MAKSKRRVEVATGTSAIASNFIDIAFDKGQSFNVHGFRVESIQEPENADANANGIWAVWVLPGGVIQNADLPQTFGEFGDEKWAPYLWGIGVWASANQTSNHVLFAPMTSRNLEAGSRIVFQLRVNGVSAGLVRHNESITCFTKAIA